MKIKNGFLRKGILPVVAVLLLSLTFSACNKDKNDNVRTPAAGLMVFNMIPDGDPIGVAVGGNILTSLPLSYTNYSGGYQALFVGERTVETFDYNTRKSLASATQNFKDSSYYSMFAMGADENYANVIVKDDFEGLDNSEMAYVRFVNAIPDSSKPEVMISENGNDIFNEAAAYKAVSSFKSVTPGEISVAVKNGNDIDESRTITLDKNKIYTILLSGIPGDADHGVEIKFIPNGSIS